MAARDVVVRLLTRYENSDAARKLEADLRKLGPAGDAAVKGIDRITSSLTSRLGPASGAAKSKLDDLGKQALVSGDALSLGVAGGVAAFGAAVAALGKRGVDEFIKLTDEVRNFQRASGASAEDSSRLIAAMDDLGISAESGSTAVFRLARNTDENADAFERFGVEIARNKDGTTDLVGTLLNASDAYRSTADAGTRANLVMTLFGRSGQAIVPILDQGSKKLQEFFADAAKHGQIVDQSQVDEAQTFKLAVDDLSDAVSNLERSIGEGAIGSLTDLANGMSAVIDKAGNFTRSIRDAIPHVAFGPFQPFAEILFQIGHHSSTAAREQRSFANATAELAKEIEEEAAAVKDFDDAVLAPLRVADALDRVRQATERLADARAEDPAAEIARGERAVAAARDHQLDAVEREQNAEKALDRLRRGSVENLRALHRAEVDLEQSRAGAADAQDRLNEAQAERDRIFAESASTPEQRARAEGELRDARADLDSANVQVEDSEQAVNDLRNPEHTQAFADAERAVRDARREVADAADAEKDAEGRLAEAHRDATDKAADVAAAERDVYEAIVAAGQAAGPSADAQIEALRRVRDIAGPEFAAFVDGVVANLDRLRSNFDTTRSSADNLRDGFAQLYDFLNGGAPLPAPQTGADAITGLLVPPPGVPAVPTNRSQTDKPLSGVGAAAGGTINNTWHLNITGPTVDNLVRQAKQLERTWALTR